MTTVKEQSELYNRIIQGMDRVYEKLIEEKQQKNSKLVVMRGNKIVEIKPEKMIVKKTTKYKSKEVPYTESLF